MEGLVPQLLLEGGDLLERALEAVVLDQHAGVARVRLEHAEMLRAEGARSSSRSPTTSAPTTPSSPRSGVSIPRRNPSSRNMLSRPFGLPCATSRPPLHRDASSSAARCTGVSVAAGERRDAAVVRPRDECAARCVFGRRPIQARSACRRACGLPDQQLADASSASGERCAARIEL